MAVAECEGDEELQLKVYLEHLAVCNAETDTLAVTLEAFKKGFISKEGLRVLTSINPEVSTVEKRRTLLKHVCKNLEEMLFDLVTKSSKLDVQALTVLALKKKLINKHVFDHFTSMHSEVPGSMKYRYLFQCVRQTLCKELQVFKKRALFIVPPYKLIDEPEPFRFAKDAEREGLIDKCVVDYIVSLLPKAPLITGPIGKQMMQNLPEVTMLRKSLANEATFLQHPSTISSSATNSLIIPQQFSKVNELLANYAYSWKEIGIALEFQPQDLKNIETSPTLIPNAPSSYLTMLLEDWMFKKYEHTLPPSVGCLKRALSSQTVRLGSLADEIEGNLGERALQTPINLSYCLITPESFFQKCDVYIREGISTLLEIETPSSGDDLNFKWLKDGVKLTDSVGRILCLHQVDLELDGCELSCQIPLTNTVAPTITVNVTSDLDIFRSDLASTYLVQPEVPEDTWPPVSRLKYINLALVNQQKVNYNSEYARLTIRGDVDDILQDKQIITYHEKNFFRYLSSGKLVLIEGRPGSGKTTFVHKLAHDWAVKTGGSIRLLLLVSLRVLNTFRNPDLSDILKLFRDLKVTKETIEQRSGKGVCFIFDGFDEFSHQNGQSVVYDIINKTYLHQSVVIVASRPAAIANLRCRASTIIEVVGFLNKQIFEFIDHYPFSTKSKSDELKTYLDFHPNVLHMCYLPIHATMVAFLFQEMGKVPKTETEMYTHFTRFTLIRNLTKNREFEPVDIDLHNLTGEQKICFKQICLLAYKKILLSEQVLNQSEVNSHFQVKRSIDSSLGLITIDRTAGLYGYKNVYTFVHLTFQEYLAAYHITTLSDEEQKRLIRKYGGANHMSVVWKFYCGLTTIQPHDDKFKSIISKSKGDTLFHIRCGYEAQQKKACVQVLKSAEHHFKLENKFLSIPDFSALGYITNSTLDPTKLSLLNCNMNVDAIDSLLSEIDERPKNSIHELHIETEVADTSHMECIKKLLANLKSLTTVSLVAKRSEVLNLTDSSRSELSNLTDLYFVNIDVGLLLNSQSFENLSNLRSVGAINFFSTCLQHCKYLHRLDVSGSNIGDEGAIALGQSLRSGYLEELNVSRNNIGEKGGRVLAGSLQDCKYLKWLDLSGNSISDSSARVLAKALKDCNNLERINLAGTNLQSLGVAAILKSLKQCYLKVKVASEMPHVQTAEILQSLADIRNLQSLEILLEKKHLNFFRYCTQSWKRLKELDVTFEEWPNAQFLHPRVQFHHLKALVIKIRTSTTASSSLLPHFEQCPNLERLDLSNNWNISSSFETICAGLRYPCLIELDLNSSCIGNQGVESLSLMLKHCSSLLKLNLASNAISKEGCDALAANLHSCTNLERLDFESNYISNAGAHAIISSLKHCEHFLELNLKQNPCCSVEADQNLTFSILIS